MRGEPVRRRLGGLLQAVAVEASSCQAVGVWVSVSATTMSNGVGAIASTNATGS
jgi:hypothetical protein